MEFQKIQDRLSALFDDGKYTEINSGIMEKDKPASVVTAYGYVNGNPVYAFAQDKSVSGGAVGMAHAEKISKLYLLASKTGNPIVGIYDSNGAVMDGTAESLMAYGKMISSSSAVSGVIPQIAVIAGTCAGSASILACSSDFVIMAKDSEFFMTPNAENVSAESAMKAGIASAVCDDVKSAIEKARDIINIMPLNNLSPAPEFEPIEPVGTVSPDLKGIINGITDSDTEIELYSGCGKASYTAFARIEGKTVGIVATNKTSDRLESADCSKIARFVRLCDAFSVPVVTFADTDGFDTSDTVSNVKNMSLLASSYAEATTVKLAVVTGKAVGTVFSAIAGKDVSSDFTYAWESAYISPVLPETAVEFLWHDKLKGAENLSAKRKELAEEYKSTLASAEKASNIGCIDEVISASDTRAVISSALDMLSGKRVAKLPKKHNNLPF
ncbi:MAG: carboxyl transferase domain-containing protein [Ruminococcus sp.]|nr:carboxyl transferase domain-containing protein [Oscillospiraceae bacterium]MDY4413463.1 carboxyl transferase domain-containing protein [Ruminococcus sp.]